MGNLIVKSNAFVGASYGLGITEQRLLLLAILKARETDNISEAVGKRLVIHASDYMKVFGVDRATAYESLENAVKGLYESEYQYIEILPTGERKTHRYRFVSSIAYADGLGLVEMAFTLETVPLVVGLSENFTKYEIEQVSRLSSQYALRLYELLSQWRKNGKCTLGLAELRFKFGLLDDEYPRMDNFKRWVLDMAVNEISKYTDLSITYEQHKEGRKIVGFTFNIKSKSNNNAKTKDEKDPNTIDLIDGLTETERKAIQDADEYANRINATDEHRKNLIARAKQLGKKQAKKEHEQHEQATKEAMQALAQNKAEQQARQAELARIEQEKQALIARFESLPKAMQEYALEQIEPQIVGVFKKIFEQERADGTAHKNPMFFSYFKPFLE